MPDLTLTLKLLLLSRMMPPPPIGVRLIQVGLFYLMLIWLGLMLLMGNLLLIPLVVVPKHLRAPFVQWLISGLFQVFLESARLCGLMYLDLKALDALNGKPGVLIIANHPSMIDVVLLISRLTRTACLMKASIGQNLFFGIGSHLGGYVSNRHTDQMLRSAAHHLQLGGQLLMFPEGTRTVKQPINTLKRSAGLISVRAKCTLQPVLIETNSGYIGKGWGLFKPPAFPLYYRARLGPPMQPGRSITETTEQVRAYFSSALTRSIDPDFKF